MSKQTHTVEILGRSYRVGCPEGEQDALQQATGILNQRLTEMRQRMAGSNEQLAIMAALNLSHDLLLEQQKSREYSRSMDERIQLLQDTIEQALLEQGQRALVQLEQQAQQAEQAE